MVEYLKNFPSFQKKKTGSFLCSVKLNDYIIIIMIIFINNAIEMKYRYRKFSNFQKIGGGGYWDQQNQTATIRFNCYEHHESYICWPHLFFYWWLHFGNNVRDATNIILLQIRKTLYLTKISSLNICLR